MMPNLTPDQKEQLKMARRSNMRIEETWQLYTMFLSADKRPSEALEKAVEAVSVWADWMDQNEVAPPEIEHPDFAAQLTQGMKEAFQTITGQKPQFAIVAGEHGAQIIPQGAEQIDAEFEPSSQTSGKGESD